jgi:hypothetical protein
MTNNGEFGLTEHLIDRATNEMELPMKLAESSLFIKYVDQLTKNAHGSVVKSLLADRFGSLDKDLDALIPHIVKLSPSEFTPLLLKLSRAELIDKFTSFIQDNDDDQDFRLAGVELLAQDWKNDPDVLPWLKDHAQHGEDQDFRCAAVMALAQDWKDDPDVLPWLKNHAQHDPN